MCLLVLGVGGFIAKARSRQTNVKRQMSEVSAEMADGQPRPEGKRLKVT